MSFILRGISVDAKVWGENLWSPMNTLYYGDNLNILRRCIRHESVDLVYLDPPFNSIRNYNVLFKEESGLEADSGQYV